MIRLHTRLFSSSTKGSDTFKSLAKNLARPEEIKDFKNKKLKITPLKENAVVSLRQKGISKSLMVKEPMTFEKIIEKSAILSKIEDDEDIDNSDEFLEQAADYLAKESKSDVIDWTTAMEMVKESEITYIEPTVDRNEVLAKPGVRPMFNVASVVNHSPTLQRLVDLGTKISEWEQKQRLDLVLRLDFSQDVAPRIQMLIDIGISPDALGNIFTENPEIFDQTPEDLAIRLNYLTWRKFSSKQVCQIIMKSDSKWLNYQTTDIDARLGFLQKIFALANSEVRGLASTCPNLVIWKGTPTQVEYNTLDLDHAMGFKRYQIKSIVKKAPKVFMENDSETIQERFDVLHNEAGYSHDLITKLPKCLMVDCLKMKARLKFLQKLGRDQFNPQKPNFVNPEAFATSDDEYFCNNVAKVPIELFNKFQQTF